MSIAQNLPSSEDILAGKNPSLSFTLTPPQDIRAAINAWLTPADFSNYPAVPERVMDGTATKEEAEAYCEAVEAYLATQKPENLAYAVVTALAYAVKDEFHEFMASRANAGRSNREILDVDKPRFEEIRQRVDNAFMWATEHLTLDLQTVFGRVVISFFRLPVDPSKPGFEKFTHAIKDYILV